MSNSQAIAPKIKSGKELYQEMLTGFDYSPIRWTIMRYTPEISEENADNMIDAFLQWIALSPLNTNERYMVMFKTPVEEAFHNFVLNTRLYAPFCDKFLGRFFHHEPLTEENQPTIEPVAKYTVELLQAEYKDDLNPLLKDWIQQFKDGTYHVACVGPGGHC